jgi:hypothetical protein
MARIELRDAVIKIKDGLAGTALVNQPSTAAAEDDTALTLEFVTLNTDDTDLVPVGARFTMEGETASTTVHTVTARTPTDTSPTTDITFTPALGAGTYTSSGTNEQQEISIDAGVTGGTFTLTFDGYTTSPLAYNIAFGDLDTALEALTSIGTDNVTVTGTAPTWTVEFTGTLAEQDVSLIVGDGSSLTGGSTEVTVTETVKGVRDNAMTLTFASQEVEIKVGDGDVTYTENTEYIYDLDRGDLDTVREGDQVPMDVSFDIVYEHITTGTSENIAPMDALKRKGSASEWVSSATDKCEPYAVDIEITHTPPCGTSELETTTFPDFRSESREISFADSVISVSGRCNAVEPIVERSSS